MKKIVLLLAAAVALASCVKENTFEQTQPADGLVTIKALAMDTKTTLGETTGEEGSRQTAVLWEATDKIMVVYENVDGDNNNDDIITEFEVSGTPEGTSATFKGQYNSTDFPAKAKSRPIAVYPSSSVTDDGQGNFVIEHNLPEEQYGINLSGLLLSSAVLKDEDLMEGTATATFNNALTLLKVVVPEGVKSVALTSDKGLVGDAQFTVSNTYSEEQVWDDDSEGYVTNVTEATGKLGGLGNNNTVTLSDGGAELDAKTYHVLIYPHNASTFKVTMTGMTDDVKYESTLTNLTFTAGEFRTLNLTKIFKMEVNETEAVSPMGGKLTIPVMAAEQETYYVEENADWISVVTSTYVKTKAFTGTNIVLDIQPNTTGASRTAEVTITWSTDGERKFTISQENAYLDFVYVDGDPANELIQWEESFGIFTDAALASSVQVGGTPLKYENNKFTIDISDDPAKGAYVIDGMFVMRHALNGLKGGKYYANYKDGKLLVFAIKNATQSYYFPPVKDTEVIIELAYDAVNKTFSCADALAFNANLMNADYSKAGYIGNYEAHHYVAPDPGSGDSFAGDWNQTVTFGSNSAVKTGASAAVTVSVSGDQITLENFIFSGCTATGTLSGKTITISANNSGLPTTYGPVDNDIVITLSDDMKTMTASNITSGMGYGIVVDSWTAER